MSTKGDAYRTLQRILQQHGGMSRAEAMQTLAALRNDDNNLDTCKSSLSYSAGSGEGDPTGRGLSYSAAFKKTAALAASLINQVKASTGRRAMPSPFWKDN